MNMKKIMLKLMILITCFLNVNSKVFQRCELANILAAHRFNHNDISKMVCIAYHQSRFDSAAYNKGGFHGIFQIAEKFWCNGKGLCKLPCQNLRDNDITDDINCSKIIMEEYRRISGDKFAGWGETYANYCAQSTDNYLKGCNQRKKRQIGFTPNTPFRQQAKVYERCEFARELYYQHKIPSNQLQDWVCIAMHESNFNTASVGRKNKDYSLDHGIFQISDKYWCRSSTGNGHGCGISCNRFLDSNIADDVNCVRKIYNEFQRLTGNGFTAWSVYNLHCRNKRYDYLSGCFKSQSPQRTSVQYFTNTHRTRPRTNPITQTFNLNGLNFLSILDHKNAAIRKRSSPKIYQPCDLALELNLKHKIPEADLPIWVCIAKHESDFNTSALGYGDHGLFQISEVYWCSKNDGVEKSCRIPCTNLRNDDITDDMECVKQIFKEHQRLTGDGFNAWTVYPLYCDNGRALKYTEKCDDTKYISTQPTVENNILSHNVFLKPIFEITSTTEYIPTATTKQVKRTTTFKYETSKLTTTTQRTTTQRTQTLKPTSSKYQVFKPELTKIPTKTTPKTSPIYASITTKAANKLYSTRSPLNLQKSTTKPPNNGKYDSGQYDSGRYSQSQYNSGIYNSGKYENTAKTGTEANRLKREKTSESNVYRATPVAHLP